MNRIAALDPSTPAQPLPPRNSGEYSFVPTADGFIWEIPAGPMTIRYTATVKGDQSHEVGERVMPGVADVRFFEMTLTRIGDSSWPAAGADPAE